MPVAQPIRSASPPPAANMNQGIGVRNNNINNRSAPRVNQQQPRIPGRPDAGRGAPGRNSINEEGVFGESTSLLGDTKLTQVFQ